MKIPHIKTDADLRAAIKEVERLWNAAPGSADEDELERLAIMIGAYESKRRPTPTAEELDLDPLDPKSWEF
jgi:HTH-type transcriptional regulator / antitoxin HigA